MTMASSDKQTSPSQASRQINWPDWIAAVAAVIALGLSGLALYISEQAVTTAEEASRSAGPRRVIFTAARQSDGTVAVVIHNLSLQWMQGVQFENRNPARAQVTAVRLRDLPYCMKTYYKLDGSWWESTHMHLVFQDPDGNVWAKPFHDGLVEEDRVDTDLTTDTKTYDINVPAKDAGRLVITRTKKSVDIAQGCQ